MIEIIQKRDCCGCGACQQVCPKNCITMQADTEGFLYPQVDERLCVECGACRQACPILNKPEAPNLKSTAYAACTKDFAVRKESSSGGVFSVLAEGILEQGGVVFGAAFDADFSVHHIMVQRTQELPLLRGSKYVQSPIEDTYREAKAELKRGRRVLFTGTGCQIAGLKAYLGREHENLYTVDILCHGVPSETVWRTYLRRQEEAYGAKVTAVSFRNKEQGWNRYCMEQMFQNGKRYCQPHEKDLYMQWFLGDISLRPSCYDCKFKDIPRLSDLTIGDAWGIERIMPDMDDDQGTSVVLVHSEKGRYMWAQVEQELTAHCVKLADLLPPDADARRSVRPHRNRERFFEMLRQGAESDQLLRLTRKPLLRRGLSAGKRLLRRLLRK